MTDIEDSKEPTTPGFSFSSKAQKKHKIFSAICQVKFFALGINKFFII